jgi:hypothetical protein
MSLRLRMIFRKRPTDAISSSGAGCGDYPTLAFPVQIARSM